MNSHVGGKTVGASSSSDFLRVYRAGILAGANASYAYIPKKAAKSYASSHDLLELQNQRGAIEDLSSFMMTSPACPVVPPLPPLQYVSTNNFYATRATTPAGLTYANDGFVYMIQYWPEFDGNNLYQITAGGATNINFNLRGISSITLSLLQSHIDRNFYTLAVDGSIWKIVITDLGIAITAISDPDTISSASCFVEDPIAEVFYVGRANGTSSSIVSVPFARGNRETVVYAFTSSIVGITVDSRSTLYIILENGQLWTARAGQTQLLAVDLGLPAGIVLANDNSVYVTSAIGGVGYIFKVTSLGVSSLFTRGNGLIRPTTIIQIANENFIVYDTGASTFFQIVVA